MFRISILFYVACIVMACTVREYGGAIGWFMALIWMIGYYNEKDK